LLIAPESAVGATLQRHSSGAFITSLSAGIRPPTIDWLVVAIVIDAIKGMSFRRHPHICKKVSERSSPSLANGNATTSITIKSLVRRIITTTFHIQPNTVNACLGESMLLEVLGRPIPFPAAT